MRVDKTTAIYRCGIGVLLRSGGSVAELVLPGGDDCALCSQPDSVAVPLRVALPPTRAPDYVCLLLCSSPRFYNMAICHSSACCSGARSACCSRTRLCPLLGCSFSTHRRVARLARFKNAT